MSNNKYIVTGIAVALVLGVAAVLGFHVSLPSSQPLGGALANALIEQYIAPIKYLGGYNSALPIQTTSTITGVGITSTGASTLTGGATFGSSGTKINTLVYGPCFIKAYSATIAASTTITTDCQATAAVSANGIAPITGVLNTDTNIVATFSTTTAGTTFQGLVLIGATASTTNGYIVVTIANDTGAVFTWPVTGTATGTVAFIDTK